MPITHYEQRDRGQRDRRSRMAAFLLFRYQCKYKFEAMRGLGVDRHMFGLYVVAKGMNMDPLPRMFQDKV